MDLNMRNTEVSKEYSYSYSGSDCRAYAFFDQNEISKIQTLHSEYFKYHKPKINTRLTEQTILAYPNIIIPALPDFNYKNQDRFFDVIDNNIVFSNTEKWNVLKDNFKINIDKTYLNVTGSLLLGIEELVKIVKPAIINDAEVYPAYSSEEILNIFSELNLIFNQHEKILLDKRLGNLNLEVYVNEFKSQFNEIKEIYKEGVSINEVVKQRIEENLIYEESLEDNKIFLLEKKASLNELLNSDLNLFVKDFDTKEEAVEAILVDVVGFDKEEAIIRCFFERKKISKDSFVQEGIREKIKNIKDLGLNQRYVFYDSNIFDVIKIGIPLSAYKNGKFEENIVGVDLKIIDDLIKNIYDNKIKRTDTYDELFFGSKTITKYVENQRVINSEISNSYNKEEISDVMDIGLQFLNYTYEESDNSLIINKSQKELLNDYIDLLVERTFFDVSKEELLKAKKRINFLLDLKKSFVEAYSYYGATLNQNKYDMSGTLDYIYNGSGEIILSDDEIQFLKALVESKIYIEEFSKIVEEFNNESTNENIYSKLDTLEEISQSQTWFNDYFNRKKEIILKEIEYAKEELQEINSFAYIKYISDFKKNAYNIALNIYENLMENIEYLRNSILELEITITEIREGLVISRNEILQIMIPLVGENYVNFLSKTYSYLNSIRENIKNTEEIFIYKLGETKKNWFAFIKDLKAHQDAVEKSKATKTIYTEEEYTTYTLEENKPLIDWYNNPVHLDSIATVSVSIHEAKAPVRRLGHRAVSGYTRAIRTIAGSMVFVIVKDHPLRLLAAKDPGNFDPRLISWSKDLIEKGHGSLEIGEEGVKFDNKISTVISPFNLILHYQTETKSKNTNGASLVIEGVEFMNEGIVTSVNDLITEVVVQFVARDIKQFTASDSAHAEDIKAAYENISANAKDALYKTTEYNTGTGDVRSYEYNSEIKSQYGVTNLEGKESF